MGMGKRTKWRLAQQAKIKTTEDCCAVCTRCIAWETPLWVRESKACPHGHHHACSIMDALKVILSGLGRRLRGVFVSVGGGRVATPPSELLCGRWCRAGPTTESSAASAHATARLRLLRRCCRRWWGCPNTACGREGGGLRHGGWWMRSCKSAKEKW